MQTQAYIIAVILFLTLVTNYEDRRTKSKFHLKEGLYNIVLFGVTCGMSFSISNYVLLGPVHYLNFGEEEIGEGGRGLWNLMVGVDYSSVMFVSTFALFYLDELRKRVSTRDDLSDDCTECLNFDFDHWNLSTTSSHLLKISISLPSNTRQTLLFGMGMLTLALAFHDLPRQKDIWQDASGRQSISMLIFFFLPI